MVSFSSALKTIDREMSPHYIGGAIRWADDNRNMSWSKSIDKLETILILESNDFKKQLAIDEYVNTVKNLIKEFKMSRQAETADDFINQIQMDFGV